MTETLCFHSEDFADDLPQPGHYPATVDVASYGRSARGNEMLRVVYVLEGAPRGRERVTEYFVLSGGSPRGCAVARRRLLQLFRACGLEPRPGEEISPAELFGQRLDLRVGHEDWQGETRLRVTGYRRLDPGRAPF